MKKLRCIIVEDEPLAAERLRSYVLRRTELALVGIFEKGEDALDFIRNNAIDLAFLDINLGAVSGIRIAEKAGDRPHIVFTTAYPDYAVKGFELSADDYLLKPFHFDRFSQAVDRVLSREGISEAGAIWLKVENRSERIALNDILLIEGMDDYRKVITTSGKRLTSMTFRELESKLENTSVVRVHRSYMVNFHHVTSVRSSEVIVIGLCIPVSESYRDVVLKWRDQ